MIWRSGFEIVPFYVHILKENNKISLHHENRRVQEKIWCHDRTYLLLWTEFKRHSLRECRMSTGSSFGVLEVVTRPPWTPLEAVWRPSAHAPTKNRFELPTSSRPRLWEQQVPVSSVQQVKTRQDQIFAHQEVTIKTCLARDPAESLHSSSILSSIPGRIVFAFMRWKWFFTSKIFTIKVSDALEKNYLIITICFNNNTSSVRIFFIYLRRKCEQTKYYY